MSKKKKKTKMYEVHEKKKNNNYCGTIKRRKTVLGPEAVLGKGTKPFITKKDRPRKKIKPRDIID